MLVDDVVVVKSDVGCLPELKTHEPRPSDVALHFSSSSAHLRLRLRAIVARCCTSLHFLFASDMHSR